jgi:hypothetical protein
MGKKIYLPTFLLAIAVPIALAIVSGSVGIHSTPGIRLFIAGLPGTIVGAWTVMVFGSNNPLFYFTTALANWAFYLSLAKGVILLKGKIQGTKQPGG